MSTEHFSDSEFACKCCGEVIINPRLLELLEQLRYNCGGYPLFITSGYRCPSHNREEGGATYSQHMLGNAADIARPDALSYGEFMWYVDQLPFDGVGNYPNGDFIHVDVRFGGTGGPGNHVYWDGP